MVIPRSGVLRIKTFAKCKREVARSDNNDIKREKKTMKVVLNSWHRVKKQARDVKSEKLSGVPFNLDEVDDGDGREVPVIAENR